MSDIKIIEVPHLGGISAAYQMPKPYDSSKPTMVMINSHRTTSDLYKLQFEDPVMSDAMNMIAIEPLGHGQTRTKSEHFTFWDTAIMNLQVLAALGIEEWYVLGTSQGGWVTVRMALLAPDKCLGILPLGTSMDYESKRSTDLGCWDGYAANTPIIETLTSNKSTPDFEIADQTCHSVLDRGFGPDCSTESRQFWIKELKKNYRGDDGRQRLRMAAINLRDRDGLHGRLSDVRCPVLWLHGTADQVYSVRNAKEEIKMFINSPEARLETIDGGQHFLSYSHPREVNEHVLSFVKKLSKK